MAITASYGFDGTINEAQWSTLHQPVGTGHVSGMAATVGSGTREVDIASGTAWAVGTYHIASATTVALSANASGNTRIDTIVVDIDFSTDTATVEAVEGTPAASPVPPTLTQTPGTQWQIPLCHVTVVDGETAFSAADIADVRPTAGVQVAACSYLRNASADVSPSDGTWLDIAIAQTNVAVGGMRIVDSRDVVVPVDGIYEVVVQGRLNCATANAQLAVQAAINDNTSNAATVAYGDAGASNRTQTLHASSLVSLSAEDTLTLYLRGNGSTVSVGALTGLVVRLVAAT